MPIDVPTVDFLFLERASTKFFKTFFQPHPGDIPNPARFAFYDQMDKERVMGEPTSAFDTEQTLSPPVGELDKTCADGRSNPMGPLYTLLESSTAVAFRDEYAGLPVDGSHVTWLATANSVEDIPAPQMSRFKVFEIPLPRNARLMAIAESTWDEMTAQLRPALGGLPQGSAHRLAGCSVRDMRNHLQEALGRAALRTVSAGESRLLLAENDLAVSKAQPHAPSGSANVAAVRIATAHGFYRPEHLPHP